MKKLLLFALCTLTLAACSDDDDDNNRPAYDTVGFETPEGLLAPDGKAAVPGRLTVAGFNPATFENVFSGKDFMTLRDATGNYFDGLLFTTADRRIGFGSYFADMSLDEYGPYDTWGGFVLSQNYDTTLGAAGPDYAKAQFSAWAAAGANASKTFVLGYCNNFGAYDCQMPKIRLTEPRTVAHLYLANATLTAQYRPQVEDFQFKVIVTGYRNRTAGRRIEQPLFRDGKPLAGWTKVDCSSLGEVDELRFEVESNDNDPVYGNNAPSYFCIDDIAFVRRAE